MIFFFNYFFPIIAPSNSKKDTIEAIEEGEVEGVGVAVAVAVNYNSSAAEENYTNPTTYEPTSAAIATTTTTTAAILPPTMSTPISTSKYGSYHGPSAHFNSPTSSSKKTTSRKYAPSSLSFKLQKLFRTYDSDEAKVLICTMLIL